MGQIGIGASLIGGILGPISGYFQAKEAAKAADQQTALALKALKDQERQTAIDNATAQAEAQAAPAHTKRMTQIGALAAVGLGALVVSLMFIKAATKKD
jgi:ferric-dicitrate binding protein FerR (iron transport regulator)